MTNPDAVVLGGGLAGLSAATRLAEQGRRVLVLEARRTLGGRAAAFTDPATGERVDNGQHVVVGNYHETFRFLDRIGTAHLVRLQPGLSVDMIDRRGHASRLSCPPLPPPLHLLAGILRWDALRWRDRLALSGIASALRRGPQRSGATVREWLLAHGQTGRLIELLWEPLAVAALNEPIDVASCEPFVEVLARMFRGAARDAALGLPLVPLDELYAIPSRAFLERHGGEVRTGVTGRIDASGAAPGRCAVVQAAGERVEATAVICAVPWFALPEVLGGCPELAGVVAAARATPASPIVTVNLWYDRPLDAGTFIGLPGRTMQWAFDKRLLFGESASHVSLVSSGAGAIVGQSNEALVALATAELADALPQARAAPVRRAVVVREKRATFSVAPGLPARPPTRTPLPNLFLAGDWIDTALPATIEGAVVSGHRAADAATHT